MVVEVQKRELSPARPRRTDGFLLFAGGSQTGLPPLFALLPIRSFFAMS